MIFQILTIFPELFENFRETGLLGKAIKNDLIKMRTLNIRDFAQDKHKTVDDTPYGGGAGMVLKIEPIAAAIGSIKSQIANRKSQTNNKTLSPKNQRTKIVVLSARGERFTQAKAEEYAKLDKLILICGRYEGIDQRVANHLADEEISIGPYVLNGGEVAAMAVIEAISRLVPGVLGNPESLSEESYTVKSKLQNSGGKSMPNDKYQMIEYPQYTKPEEYNGWTVPAVLLSGHHEEIQKWREEHSFRNTGMRHNE